MAKRGLELYYDLMSQPSRALYILFNIAKLPYTKKPVAIRKGEHLTDDFANNVNRFKKVPCIRNNNFKLAESVAIVKYLSREYQIPDNWYPSNSEHRAQVDEYLEWQHLNTRMACAQLFQALWIQPKMFGKQVDEKKLKEVQKYVESTLDTIEKVWLGRQNKFLVGDQISVADLFAATEILQTTMCNYDPCEGRPNLKAWLELVKKTTNPHFDDAHQFVYKLAGQGKPKL